MSVNHFVYCRSCRKITLLELARQLPDQTFLCQWCDPSVEKGQP